MKRAVVARAAAMAAGTVLGANAYASPPGTSYRLVFADEFNGTTLDANKWSAASPSWTMPNSLSTATASDVSVGNGLLTLTANRPTAAASFDSGSISSYNKYTFAGGYVEARIELPSTPGSWPAFWGLYNGWPPEADIMEYPLTTDGGTSGYSSTQYSTNYHYTNSAGANAAGAGVVNTSQNLGTSGWHTFGMNWLTSTSVTFYLDGNAVSSYTGSTVAQMASMYMILDYAVGGWPGTPSTTQWPAGWSDQTQVDWVRVWQTNSNADAPTAWTVNGGGTFATAGNWTLGVPKYGNETAVFGRVGTASTAAITLAPWQVMGGLVFNGSAGATTAYTIGASTNAIQLATTSGSAVVQATSSSTVAQTVNANLELWSNTSFINDMTTGTALNVNGAVSGAGVLTSTGVGTTILSGSNTYVGGTVLGAAGGASVLRVTNGAALGTGAVTFDLTGNGSTARLELAGGITVPNNIAFAARSNATVGIENISGSNTLAGTITTNAGGNVYLIQSDAGTLSLTGAASAATAAGVALQAGSGSRTFTLQGNGNGVVSGLVQNGGGTVSVSKAGTGVWTLGNANTYTGDTIVLGGRLVLAHSTASMSSLNVSAGATLSAMGAMTTNGMLRNAGTLDLADTGLSTISAATLNLGSGTINLQLGNGTTSDRIAATGAATVAGTNTINLSAAPGQSITSGSTYTLITAQNGLAVGNFALGTKPASLNFMQFVLSTPTAGSLVATATGNPTPTTAYWTAAGSAAAGDASNNWGSGASFNTSNWSTDAAGTVDAKQLPGSITNVIFNAANAPAATATVSSQLDSAYAVKGVTFDVGAATVTSAVLNSNGNVVSIGTGGVTLASTSNAAATLNGTSAILLTSDQNWVNQNNSKSLTIATGVTAATGATTLTLSGTGTGGVSFTGVLADGTGTLSTTFNQAGTTVLSAANTYTGTTTVAGGTVEIASTGSVAGNVTVTGGTLRLTDSPAAIAATATVNVQVGGNLDVRSATPGAAATASVGALTGGGNVTRSTSGTTTLTVGASGLSSAFSGLIQNGSGTVALAKSGLGTLSLSSSSSYTGGTTINAFGGSIMVTNPNALGSGPVTIGQGTTNEDGVLQVAGDISLAGVPTINLSSRYTSNADGSAHIENVSGNNTIPANLNINNTGGTSANVLSTSGTLNLTGNLSSTGLTAANGFDFYGAGNGVVSGVISNGTTQATFVQKDGTGTWTLAGKNTYTAGTTVNGGTLNVTGNNAWGSGALTVNDGAAVLSADNAFTGGTSITGTSTVAGGSTTTGGRVVMASPGALGASGAIVNISGNGTLVVATDGADRAYEIHVGTTNTVNLVSGVKTGTTGINHTLGNLFIGINDVVNVTAADNLTGGAPSITLGTVTLSSGFGAGSSTFNPTTASLTLGAVSTSTNSAKTLILDGTATGNAVKGAISNNANVVTLLKSNSSTWTLSASNSFTGGTTINDGGGTLQITNGNALGTGPVIIGNGGGNVTGELQLASGIAVTAVPTLYFGSRLLSTAGGNAHIENLSGNNSISANLNLNMSGGNAVNILSTAGKLTLTGSMTSTGLASARGFNFYGSGDGLASGVISNGTAQPTFVQKAGTGTWTLSGSNTYSGGTTVVAGTLVVANTSATGTGAITVTGGTLAGTGTLTNTSALTIASGGTLSAGSGSTASNSTGTLTTGPQAWSAGGTLAAKIASADGVTVTANDTLIMSTLTVPTGQASFTVSVPLTTNNGVPQLVPGAKLILANDKDTASTNPFAPANSAATLLALSLSAPSLTTTPGYQIALATQSDTLGNGGYDLILTSVAATPEPTSLLLLAATAVPLALSRRRSARTNH